MNHTRQLVEPVRITIGKMLIAHEMIKLFENLNYDELKEQIDSKWADLRGAIAIRDFWNLVDSLMMGYKLKNLIRDTTSQHYIWTLIPTQPISQLKFATDLNNLASNKKTARELKSFLEENPEELNRITEGTRVSFPENNTRHLDPIIVLSQTDGLFVHDGNGRLLKAIIEGKETINAYIGTLVQATKSNHWVPTSYLMRLAETKSEELLVTIIQESDNAFFEFKNRVDIDEIFKQKILRQASR